MMSFSIVILSRDSGNLVPCVRAIWEKEPDLAREKIIVVDDGAWPDAEWDWRRGVDRADSVRWVRGAKPFCFSRNANIGIRAAGRDDVLLLNDDALLETPVGFTGLSQQAAEHPEFGIIAATCNNVGNHNQYRQMGWGGAVREDARMVCFVAVYIPRRTFDLVGMLDEDLTGYGFDDDLYCVSIRKAGFKIGIWDGCFVDHASLNSSYRAENPEENRRRFEFNARIYERKLREMGMAENEADLRRIAECGLTA